MKGFLIHYTTKFEVRMLQTAVLFSYKGFYLRHVLSIIKTLEDDIL